MLTRLWAYVAKPRALFGGITGQLFTVGALAQLAGIGSNIVLARTLSLETFGLYRVPWIGVALLSATCLQAIVPVVSQYTAAFPSAGVADVVRGTKGLSWSVFLPLTGAYAAFTYAMEPELGPIVVAVFAGTCMLTLEGTRRGASLVAVGRPVRGGVLQAAATLGGTTAPALTAALHPDGGLLLLGVVTAVGTAAVHLAAVSNRRESSAPPAVGASVRVWRLVAIGGIAFLARDIDRIVVARLAEPSTFAWYAVGASDIPFVGVLVASISQSLQPDMASALAAGSKGMASNLWTNVSLRLARTLALAGGALFMAAPWLFPLVYGPKFQPAANVFRVYLLLLVLRSAVLTPLLLSARLDTALFRGALLLLISNASLCMVGFRLGGPVGTAAGSVLGTALVLGYYSRHGARLIGWRSVLGVCLNIIINVVAFASLAWYIQGVQMTETGVPVELIHILLYLLGGALLYRAMGVVSRRVTRGVQ